MSARISHIATISSSPAPMSTFYETVFGMEVDHARRTPELGEVLSDGYVTLNLRPRLAGHRVGLDHFGIEVDEIEKTLDKLKTDYPAIGWVAQEEDGANGDYFSHDPAGNIFALSQGPAEKSLKQERPGDRDPSTNFARWSEVNPSGRYLHHYAIRTRKLDECALFYRDIFAFTHRGPTGDDPNHYLSDGRLTLVLIPWSIQDYGGISVTGRGPDHVGFKVEDAATVQAEIEGLSTHYAPGNAPMWLLSVQNRNTDENQIRADMIAKSCPISQFQFSDKDGVFVVISDKTFAE
jgi:catechol 2,3-dioxygenase-like lactoylglutathione lyase family enzyme